MLSVEFLRNQKVLISCEIRTFSALFYSITYLPFFLTQTLTPTGAGSGKHYTVPERMLPIVFAASRLARGRYMSVGVQREACRKMPQHARHGLDVHTVLQGQRCEGVAEVMKAYPR